MSEDLEEIRNKLGMNLKLLNSINIKLDKLVNRETATKIVETLKQEDIVQEGIEAGHRLAKAMANDVVKDKLDFSDAKDKEGNRAFPKGDQGLMDLKEVTIMVITDRAVLVSKKGKQKWVPISVLDLKYILGKTMNDEDQKFDYLVDIDEGSFHSELKLTENGDKWVHDKEWSKLEVRKK